MACERDIGGRSLADVYLRVVAFLLDQPGRTAVHVVARIDDPSLEHPQVTELVDQVLGTYHLRHVDTVVNTLFPVAMAERYTEPSRLAERYRQHYARIRRLNGNCDTYFGRLVAHPIPGQAPMDQLTHLVEKLRHARTAQTMSSRYEAAVELPGESPLVYSADRDTRRLMGFPCLSLLSFHVADGRLHLAAHYRNHQFVARAYGNYYALGRLLSYIATATEWDVGELLVVSGHAYLDAGSRQTIQRLITDGRVALSTHEELAG